MKNNSRYLSGAAIIAARELASPVISMTITLAAVYAPIGLQGGLTGTLFKEFAFTLAGTVLISGIIALTLSPMMSSKLVRNNPSKLKVILDGMFNSLRDFYTKVLNVVLFRNLA